MFAAQMAGSTLPQLTEPHQQNANWRSIPGLRAPVGCPRHPHQISARANVVVLAAGGCGAKILNFRSGALESHLSPIPSWKILSIALPTAAKLTVAPYGSRNLVGAPTNGVHEHATSS
jgi:hypothetical protein